MRHRKTIRELDKLCESSQRGGYSGDVAEYAFRSNCLRLLEKILKAIKDDSNQKKYLWQTLEEQGLTRADE